MAGELKIMKKYNWEEFQWIYSTIQLEAVEENAFNLLYLVRIRY